MISMTWSCTLELFSVIELPSSVESLVNFLGGSDPSATSRNEREAHFNFVRVSKASAVY